LLLTFYLYIFPANFRAEATTITVTKTLTCDANDGDMFVDGDDYLSVHDASSAEFVYRHYDTLVIGQWKSGPAAYGIYRSFLLFDTSIIPEDANITSAVLSIYIYRDESDNDFNVTIQNGQPTYPHIPIQAEDYYYGYYVGNYGSRNTSEISGAGYWNITLTDFSIINKNGYTKLCLRSNKDIESIVPTQDAILEYIIIYSADAGSNYAPKLYVTYECEGYKYVFHGPFNEDSGLIEGAVNVTVYPLSGSAFTFELNESTPSYTLELEDKPLMFKWELAYNYTRIYIPLYTYEEIYVSEPASPYYDYQIQIIDLLGVSNAYLEARTYMNGTLYTVERRQIPGGGKLPLILTEFKTYYFRIICDQGIIDLGSETTLSPYEPLNFYLSPAQLPSEYINYENITAYAVRLNSTCIQIYYNDADERTSQINITIYSVKNNKLTAEYSQSYEANTILINWKNAIPSLEYNVKIEVSHADYGQLTWQIPIPKLESSKSENIWDSLLGWLGYWPVAPSQIISALIILFVITLASFKDAEAGLLFGAVTAGILIYLGWYAMSWGTLSIIVCLIIFFAIGRRKQGMEQA